MCLNVFDSLYLIIKCVWRIDMRHCSECVLSYTTVAVNYLNCGLRKWHSKLGRTLIVEIIFLVSANLKFFLVFFITQKIKISLFQILRQHSRNTWLTACNSSTVIETYLMILELLLMHFSLKSSIYIKKIVTRILWADEKDHL